MMRGGGGGGGTAGDRGLSRTGFTLDTWKVERIRLESFSLNAAGLTTLDNEWASQLGS